MNINFVKPVETHPPYVGILAVYALIKTLYDKVFKTYLKVIITILILFLLVQLLARNALIVSIAVLVYTAIKELNYRVMLVVVILSVALGLLIVNHPHPYLKKKLLDRLNFTEKKKFDKRLDRTKASYFVFKTSPIIGVGPGNDNRLRKEQYKALGFYNAFKYNFNSHNQFMEYLVSSGLVGLILFLCVLYFLWCFSKGANDSSKLLIIAFIFSCLTESVLERSLGIKYFALISFFILLRFSGDEQKLSQ
jgi:O-antigen ligase